MQTDRWSIPVPDTSHILQGCTMKRILYTVQLRAPHLRCPFQPLFVQSKGCVLRLQYILLIRPAFSSASMMPQPHN